MAHPHPFRFGVFGEHATTRESLIETARRAEAHGYSSFLIRDHYIAEPFGHQLAPIATLATVAAVTTDLRIGTLVIANDYRHPVLLAKEAATLDLLSGGRFELGLGAGFMRLEYERAGMPFDPPGVRVERFEESLKLLKQIFADAPCTFAGKHYTVADLDSYPKPVQRPYPPLLVGAGGKRMLSIAARQADIIELLTVSTANGTLSNDPTTRLVARVEQQLGWIREAAGDRFGQIELSMVARYIITDDRDGAAEAYSREQGWDDVSRRDVLAMPSLFIGSVPQIIEEMHARRERYGFSYWVISDASIESTAPIIAQLAGR